MQLAGATLIQLSANIFQKPDYEELIIVENICEKAV
jgi:hypothetical protein